MIISELLTEGAENAITGRELAAACGCDIRVITEQIEKERRNGTPICATSRGAGPGYYLAADREELEHYCKRLGRREKELNKTRQALIKVLAQLPDRLADES